MSTNIAPGSDQPSPNVQVGKETNRVFLVVVDESEEMSSAIRYACNRARRTGGRLALLYVIETDRDFQHWHFVGNLMEREARETALNTLNRYARQVRLDSGSQPDLYVREGSSREQLFGLVKDNPEISILVLGSAAGDKPGPLVEAVTGKYAGQIGIPVTVLPGGLAAEQIDRLT